MSAGGVLKGVWLPAIALFLGLVAGGTCLLAGPFFPVGLAGLAVWAVTGYGVYVYVRRREAEDDLSAAREGLSEARSALAAEREESGRLSAEVERLRSAGGSVRRKAKSEKA